MNVMTKGSAAGQQTNQRDFDVLIVGAGISGLGAAWHLQDKCPEKSWMVLDNRDSFGGTWDLHKYPGIRSDSDLYTFGFGFKPWSGAPVAEAPLILDYLGEMIRENGFENKIRYGHQIMSAKWSSEDQRWTLDVLVKETGETVQYTCNFLDMCQGYYDHDNPYTPEWDGMADYKGKVVHPQQWPEDMDYTGKRIVVIGSGATAATLIPKLAEKAAHVTMLQRSPTYFFAAPNKILLTQIMEALHLPKTWVHKATRAFLLGFQKMVHRTAKKNPEKVKRNLFKVLRKYISEDMIKEHFTPSYRPWQQRLAFVPDGDLFKAVRAGGVSIVTDHIDRFTEKGILTKSGDELEADIIITATGFNLLVMGGIPFEVDGEKVDFAKTWTHRGIMVSGLPNMVYFFGYLRTSWTMRVDLLAEYQCRLMKHMQNKGATSCTPTLSTPPENMIANTWVSEDEFNPGYFKRSQHLMPKTTGNYPWDNANDYYVEKEAFPAFSMDDPSMVYKKG